MVFKSQLFFSALIILLILQCLPTDGKKACSGSRAGGDKCSGKRLGPQNSFYNCKNRDGKCCAANKDGTGGLDVNKGQGREDCGFCFSGKCKA